MRYDPGPAILIRHLRTSLHPPQLLIGWSADWGDTSCALEVCCLHRPAVARLTISSAWHLKAFEALNEGKPYASQIKPFNFMLAAHLADQGQPAGIGPSDPFRLVAPFETAPRKWVRMRWTNVHSGWSYRATTGWPGGGNGVAGIKPLDSVATAYPFHSEPKRIDQDGKPCGKLADGVLRRRAVRGAGTLCIGKEAHRLEDRGLVANFDELLNVYADPRRDPWVVEILPRLRAIGTEPGGLARLATLVEMSERRMRDVLAERSRPRRGVARALAMLSVSPESPNNRGYFRGSELLETSGISGLAQ